MATLMVLLMNYRHEMKPTGLPPAAWKMNSPLLSDITNRLTSLSEKPALEASVLLAHITGKPRTWVMAHPELTLTAIQHKQLEDSLARLERGESFPYVLGHWEFFGLDFDITSDVLIPRPETELLVEKAIAWLNEHPDKRSVADVGTGSGAIAISLATNMTNLKLLATDISPKALAVAKRNARKHDVEDRIKFIECDLLPSSTTNHQTTFDLICANLPYIPTQTLHTLSVYGREPTLALDGGRDGLDLIRKLINIVAKSMSNDCLLLFEIESSTGLQALTFAGNIFPDARIQLHQDLAGHDRLLEIQT
jgi:release factor glutamine methyltransferase